MGELNMVKTIKTIKLEKRVEDVNGQIIAILETYLKGDGATPVIQSMGGPSSNIIGYKDNGEVIIGQNQDQLIKNAEIELMRDAIKEQKKFCVENGVDPDLVNIINAEKKVNDE